MLKNYFKLAVRNILRNKVFSFINIVGLAISIAVSFCIIVFIVYELSYDKQHKNYHHVYRIDSQWKAVGFKIPMTSVPLAKAIKREIPGIEDYLRIRYKSKLEFVYKNSNIKIDHNYFADPSIFNVFTYSFIYGKANSFYSKTNSIILSKSTALKIFGRTNVLGEVISFKYDSSNVDVEIVGVIKDENLPGTLIPKTIIPFALLQKLDSSFSDDDWVQLQRVITFLLVKNKIDVNEIAKKIKELNDRKTSGIPGYIMNVNFYVVPLSETYYKNYKGTIPKYLPVINKNKVIIYSAIAIAILLMACINFVLLTAAKVSTRYLEIGIRKVIGARKRDIVYQITFESVLTLMLTVPLTILLIELFFPYFQDIINIHIKSSFYIGLIYAIGLIVLSGFIGITTGLYISSLIYKMKPADILNKKITPNFSNRNFRRLLLLFQIVIFAALLISTLILKYQMHYIYKKDLGFDIGNVVVINCREIKGQEEVFKNLVIRNSGVLDYAFTFNTFPVNRGNRFKISGEKNPNDQYLMVYPLVGNDYPRFLKMELITGKFPSVDNKQKKVIINETAAKLLNYKNPVGKNILLFGRIKREIIGVVKDFHINTFRDKILPVAMNLKVSRYRLVIKISNNKLNETLNFIQTQWSKLSNTPMNYEFAEDRMKYLYKNEIRFEKLMDFFTALAILISTMGLFGLVMFSTQQRTKEIGIRKVLGASILDIMKLLSKEFITLVLVGSIFAFPIAYYFMNNWLNNFAYRIEVTPWIFAITIGFALLITMVTISFQGLKTAFANPVDSLRDE